MGAPKKIDSYVYNELVYGACQDAKETFLEEPLGYWLSGPGVQGEDFPPKPRHRDADSWAKHIHATDDEPARHATDDEWEVYARTYRDAMRFVVRYVDENWNPESEDQDHYDAVCDAVAEKLDDADFKVEILDPAAALVRACNLILAIEANPGQNPSETVKLAPKTREQIRSAVRAAGYLPHGS